MTGIRISYDPSHLRQIGESSPLCRTLPNNLPFIPGVTDSFLPPSSPRSRSPNTTPPSSP